MRSFHNIATVPSSMALPADEIVEFHAARLLLLIDICGTKPSSDYYPRVDGLTKLAKLDFFVRYPYFFDRICQAERKEAVSAEGVESTMIRHRYGPWDPRYYQVLGYLESRGLIAVEKAGNRFHFRLTSSGQKAAHAFAVAPPFKILVAHMAAVAEVCKSKSGSALKKLIYTVFKSEVADKHMGDIIT